jgi:hypothetical protein
MVFGRGESQFNQSFIVTVDAGPFQAMFQRDMTSRPISIAKFRGLLNSEFTLNPNWHDVIGKRINGDRDRKSVV